MSQDTTFNISSASSLPDADPIEITSVGDFIDKIAQIERKDRAEVFYRGHADKSWKRLPSVLRTSEGIASEHLLFRDMVTHLPQNFSACKSALDYLVQMQHYDLPTRLLDVSTNPLVALYFACVPSGDTIISKIVETAFNAGSWASYNNQETDPYTNNLKPIDEKGEFLGAAMGVLFTALRTGLFGEDPVIKEIMDMVLNPIIAEYPGLENIIKEGIEEAQKDVVKVSPQDGIVYVFSVPEGRVKHYDSDTVSVLANLAKLSYQEIDIYIESTYDEENTEDLEKFNKQKSIQILLHQIKEEKPYFEPLIRPNDLGGIFLVKAKYSNPRIINQAGAFFIFGLGLEPSFIESGNCLIKRAANEIPLDWIRRRLIIPKDKKTKILVELARIGITESYLFPEMDKYAKELKKRYGL